MPAGTDVARLLRDILDRVGVVGAAFGRDLALRSDLLAPRHLGPLAGIALPTPKLSAAALQTILERAWGRASDEILQACDVQAASAGLFHQRHRGTLKDGTRVLIQIPRHDLYGRLDYDLELLRLLARRLRRAGPWACLEAAVEGFAHSAASRRNLGARAEMLAELNALMGADAPFMVPEPCSELCGAEVLTVKPLADGQALPAVGESPGTGHRLALAWFRAALLLGRLPADVRDEHVQVLPDERLGLQEGALHELDADSRTALLDYASAAAREDPDAAWWALRRLLVPGAQAATEDQMLLRFRQADPFREGPGAGHYQGRRLADLMGTQWRAAHSGGYRPGGELVAFYRALTALEHLLRRLSPKSDALAAGLGDTRLLAGVVRTRELLAPTQITANVARYLPPVLDVVRQLDALATRPAAGAADDAGPGAGAQNTWAGVTALLALLAAAVWITEVLLPERLGSGWSPTWGVAAVSVIGGLLLWFVLRGGRR